MNRGSGSGGRHSRGRAPKTWGEVTPESFPDHHHTPVRDDVSSSGSMSSNSDRRSHGSQQDTKHSSGGSVSQNNQNVASTGCQGQGQGQRQGCSKFGSGSNSHAGRAGQRSTYSKASGSSDCSHDKNSGPVSARLDLGDGDDRQPFIEEKIMCEAASKSSSVNLDRAFMETVDHLLDASQLSEDSRPGNSFSEAELPKSSEDTFDNEKVEHSNLPFDICPPKSRSVVTLKASLLSMNKEKRNEMKRSMGGPKGIILRSGMVLLKSYLSSSEQVDVVNICRHHGLGPAGFYQPEFSNGRKMHLKLMCFGKFWDAETKKYGEVRPKDGAIPPPIPQEFMLLVDRAIKDSQTLIAENSRVKNVEGILPAVKPDICLVNYYAKSGRLGLHQDKDESPESLAKGIPVVSFSIGDSADFLYSDQEDARKADDVLLESGDVLIFGGKSRHVFHGVPAILPDTAPNWLREETNLRPGRVNLTFRQHS